MGKDQAVVTYPKHDRHKINGRAGLMSSLEEEAILKGKERKYKLLQ